jgi:hypothetical protein
MRKSLFVLLAAATMLSGCATLGLTDNPNACDHAQRALQDALSLEGLAIAFDRNVAEAKALRVAAELAVHNICPVAPPAG